MHPRHNDVLDTEELLHLAIEAMQSNQSDKALVHLKSVLDREPKHGNAQYLLGAIHAGLGMYERAIDEMKQAIESNPGLPATAHFQLGLLYLTSGNVDAARRAWASLDGLGERDPLFLFKRGLLHLAADELEECVADLQHGIKLNRLNDDLSRDMQAIADRAQVARAQGGERRAESSTAATDVPQAAKRGAGHALLSAYRRDQ
jgi:tetratricopeptide (TPR) repeat protein